MGVRSFAAAVAALALAVLADAARAQAYPEFADAQLAKGREVWLGTCQVCHTADFSGAPMVTDKAAWAPRIEKGREALYKSALGGFAGPKGTQMPPRGGNPSLTDDEVKAAVDYMVAIVPK
jgi:cytochrome c5